MAWQLISYFYLKVFRKVKCQKTINITLFEGITDGKAAFFLSNLGEEIKKLFCENWKIFKKPEQNQPHHLIKSNKGRVSSISMKKVIFTITNIVGTKHFNSKQ